VDFLDGAAHRVASIIVRQGKPGQGG
jgi:hypothetical protein